MALQVEAMACCVGPAARRSRVAANQPMPEAGEWRTPPAPLRHERAERAGCRPPVDTTQSVRSWVAVQRVAVPTVAGWAWSRRERPGRSMPRHPSNGDASACRDPGTSQRSFRDDRWGRRSGCRVPYAWVLVSRPVGGERSGLPTGVGSRAESQQNRGSELPSVAIAFHQFPMARVLGVYWRRSGASSPRRPCLDVLAAPEDAPALLDGRHGEVGMSSPVDANSADVR